MTPPDAQLSVWLTGLVGKVPIIDRVMSLLVSDFFVPVSISLILLSLWFSTPNPFQRERNQRAIMGAAVGIGFASLAVVLLNKLSLWSRPFSDYESAWRASELLFYHPHDPSFPSNPAAVSFAAATGVWLSNRRAGAVLYVLAALWSLARAYSGVHYPVDILGGALVGGIVSYLIYKVFFPFIEPLPTLCLKLASWLRFADTKLSLIDSVRGSKWKTAILSRLSTW